MSKYIHKRHNVSVLLYHLVCPAKYRRVVFTDEVDAHLEAICLEIALRYEIQFGEIGADRDRVHFLVQSVTTYQVLPHNAHFPKRDKVSVTFGEPLRFCYEEPADIVEKTRQAVEKL